MLALSSSTSLRQRCCSASSFFRPAVILTASALQFRFGAAAIAAHGCPPSHGRSMATTSRPTSSTSSSSNSSITTSAQLHDQLQQVAPATTSPVLLRPVYVHHISKTILQHLQEQHHEWLVANGLHCGLCLNANGSFVLQFPPTCTAHGVVDGGRIWTSYDSGKKQHWLSVYRRKLKARFLLKDSSSSWQQQIWLSSSSTDTDPSAASSVVVRSSASSPYNNNNNVDDDDSYQQIRPDEEHLRRTVVEMITLLEQQRK